MFRGLQLNNQLNWCVVGNWTQDLMPAEQDSYIWAASPVPYIDKCSYALAWPPLAHWPENLEVSSFSQSPIGSITGPCMDFAKLLSSRLLPCSVLTAYLSCLPHSFFTPLSQNCPSVTASCGCCCCLVTSVLPVLQGLPLVLAQGWRRI